MQTAFNEYNSVRSHFWIEYLPQDKFEMAMRVVDVAIEINSQKTGKAWRRLC
jgi:hypothetical protein